MGEAVEAVATQLPALSPSPREDSVTETSPGPLKAGAFLMSAWLPSKPRVVPVAFANIDKPPWRAVFSCVVKPAFSMEEREVDVENRESREQFLETFREEFRGWVEDATDLAHQLEAPEPDLEGIMTNLGEVDAERVHGRAAAMSSISCGLIPAIRRAERGRPCIGETD